MSLSARILAGLLLGVATGLFVGEPAGVLEVAGDAFIRLLQMIVLPYIVVSLIAGLGRLDLVDAKRLGLWGGGGVRRAVLAALIEDRLAAPPGLHRDHAVDAVGMAPPAGEGRAGGEFD